ncbi:Pectinesterase A precursor [Paenibacillus konkukensis]|uniref:Pectinesterase n=1 Tax=Paenibacillus konkukensis TaxID=2020716 RepID=A0ABY4RR79_9BACL|nr:pectinesterase family protein [Paenibacillus konkukensis]UQZ84214.1 Pectinesterase A precursor [Paenibacillus konkukensis]
MIIVAADGSGNFCTVQEAVDHIPDNNKERVVISIKNGVYKEKLHIEKPLISLIGESAEHTIITFDDYAKKTFPNGEVYETFHSYSVFIGADDFTAERLTFSNSAGRGELVGQAVAAYVDADRVSFADCRFLGYQDTLFTGPLPPAPMKRGRFGGPREGMPRRHGRHYYRRCYIEGDVDFIFGSATAVFHDCEIFSKGRRFGGEDASGEFPSNRIHGWLTAPSTPEDVHYGYVFHGCRLTGDAPPRSVYLSRPWRNYAKAAFLNCWMGEHIAAAGWDNWNKPESEATTVFCEYDNRGPGAAAQERAAWSSLLTAEEAEAYAISKVLAGSDGWDPAVS